LEQTELQHEVYPKNIHTVLFAECYIIRFYSHSMGSFDRKGGVKTLNCKIHFNINLHRRYISDMLYTFSSSQKNTLYAYCLSERRKVYT